MEEMSLRSKEDKDKEARKIKGMQDRAAMSGSVLYGVSNESETNEEVIMEEDMMTTECLQELLDRLERGEDVDLDMYSSDIKKSFEAFTHNEEEVSKLIDIWNPWWLKSIHDHTSTVSSLLNKHKIEVIESDVDQLPPSSTSSSPSSTQTNVTSKVKKTHLIETYPCVVYLRKKQLLTGLLPLPKHISDTVPFSALEVIYWYCYHSRRYNGEYGDKEMCCMFLSDVFSCSMVLSKQNVVHNCTELIQLIMDSFSLRVHLNSVNTKEESHPSMSSSSSSGLSLSDLLLSSSSSSSSHKSEELLFMESVMDDVVCILDSVHYILDVFAHLSVLLKHADVMKKSERVALSRKCEFFLQVFESMDEITVSCLKNEFILAVSSRLKGNGG